MQIAAAAASASILAAIMEAITPGSICSCNDALATLCGRPQQVC
jgi:hypothetical protein